MKRSAQARDDLPGSSESNRRLGNLLTPDGYRSLYDNRLLFHRFFAAGGLALPQVYGVYDPHVGFTVEGGSLRTAEELRAWLTRWGDRGLVLKPVERIGRHRTLVFRGRAEGAGDILVTLAGERYGVERLTEFIRHSSGQAEHNGNPKPVSFLLEQRVQPHPQMVESLGPALCPLRVQTIVALDGAPRIIAAVLRLPPPADSGDGDTGYWVDLETGRLGSRRLPSHPAGAAVTPGTDRSSAEWDLPDWAGVINLALRAAAAFPWARAIGWDIGISDQGPILLGGNPRLSPALVQGPAPGGLMTGELKALCENLENERRKGARTWTRR